MAKDRLDKVMLDRGMVRSRSEAESWIKLGKVSVNGKPQTKPGHSVSEIDKIRLHTTERYVSRAGLKLASVTQKLGVEFGGKVVLDVGSSTGGFTDYALQHGARRVYAVDVGTDQLHASLRKNQRIELHEKTDIRDVVVSGQLSVTRGDKLSTGYRILSTVPDIIVIDVSFISLREILPHIAKHIAIPGTLIVAMLKPQFEAGREQVNRGVIKNNAVRRQILRDFELWSKQYFVIVDKADSDVAGAKGNQERFYLLTKLL